MKTSLLAKAYLEGFLVVLVAIIAVVLIGIADASVSSGSMASSHKLAITVDDDFMPGNPLPKDGGCWLTVGSSDVYSCTASDGTEVDVEYRRDADSIEYAVFMDLKDNVGDAFMAFGAPNGYDCDGVGWTFFWNDRSIYVVPRYALSMWSTVGYISYGSPTTDYKIWTHGLPQTCDKVH